MEVDLDTFSFVDSPGRRERRIYKKKKPEENREEETGRKYDPERSGLERVRHSDKRRKFCVDTIAAPRDQKTNQTPLVLR